MNKTSNTQEKRQGNKQKINDKDEKTRWEKIEEKRRQQDENKMAMGIIITSRSQEKPITRDNDKYDNAMISLSQDKTITMTITEKTRVPRGRTRHDIEYQNTGNLDSKPLLYKNYSAALTPPLE